MMQLNNEDAEPALIDPTLPVNAKRPDWDGDGLDYWPSYGTIPPATRAAYLTWLAGGRRHPDVPAGLLFLFFYGLERRVLVDALQREQPEARAELPQIRAEVATLVERYPDASSFPYYCKEFLELIDFALATDREADPDEPPPIPENNWNISSELRLGLAKFAAAGRPLPASWALSWALSHPYISRRNPSTRCPEEFAELFAHVYAERHTGGMLLPTTGSAIRFTYRAASAGLKEVNISSDWTDVAEMDGPTAALRDMVNTCCDQLDAYSRLLGRTPEAQGTLAAGALLPASLLRTRVPQATAMAEWAESVLAGRSTAMIDAADLAERWTGHRSVQLTRKEAVTYAGLLSNLGYGFEPDPRTGGSVPDGGPVLLFRVDAQSPTTASPAYRAATLLVHLAMAVAGADGTLSDAELDHLRDHVENNLNLTPGERHRLHAHMQLLAVTGVKLTGLRSRIDQLNAGQRRSLGEFVIAVAASDGVVEPSEIQSLTRIFKLLSLDFNAAFSTLQSAAGRTPLPRPQPAAKPVVIRGDGEPSMRYTIPAAPAVPTPSPAQSIQLDPQLIQQKLAETSAVAAMLSSIFTDEPRPLTAPDAPDAATPPTLGPTTNPIPVLPSAASEQSRNESAPVPASNQPQSSRPSSLIPPLRGLDDQHSYVVRCMIGRRTIDRADFDLIAEQVLVLPAGAIDVINEASYERTGDPLLEGEDPIEVNTEALREFLS